MASSQEAALAFITVLKRNLPHFKAFSEALIDFMDGDTDGATIVTEVLAILHGDHHFMVCFNIFLPENSKIAIPDAEQLTRIEKFVKGLFELVNKVRKYTEEDDVYSEFRRVFTGFHVHKDIVRLDKEMSGLFKSYPELYIDFSRIAAESWPAPAPDDGQNQDLARTAPIKTLEWDKALVHGEDTLYEGDMIFHYLESTKKATEKLLKETEGEKGNGDYRINLEDYYSAMNLRCIQFMYKDYEEDIMAGLQNNPKVPSVLLRRLNEKLEAAGELRNSCANK